MNSDCLFPYGPACDECSKYYEEQEKYRPKSEGGWTYVEDDDEDDKRSVKQTLFGQRSRNGLDDFNDAFYKDRPRVPIPPGEKRGSYMLEEKPAFIFENVAQQHGREKERAAASGDRRLEEKSSLRDLYMAEEKNKGLKPALSRGSGRTATNSSFRSKYLAGEHNKAPKSASSRGSDRTATSSSLRSEYLAGGKNEGPKSTLSRGSDWTAISSSLRSEYLGAEDNRDRDGQPEMVSKANEAWRLGAKPEGVPAEMPSLIDIHAAEEEKDDVKKNHYYSPDSMASKAPGWLPQKWPGEMGKEAKRVYERVYQEPQGQGKSGHRRIPQKRASQSGTGKRTGESCCGGRLCRSRKEQESIRKRLA